MRILVTGGAGYIGSHTIVELCAAGHDVIALDNLVNSTRESVRRVERITGKTIPFYKVDCANKTALRKVFTNERIGAVMHFAALKAVGESMTQPLRYYRNNLDAILTLCEVMQEFDVKRLIFSSTATVYTDVSELPWSETSKVGEGINSTYGRTKYMAEHILRDLARSDHSWQITLLRYFNPVGAHESGLIGEDPEGIPNNLFPFVAQVVVGRREVLRIFGDDYDTPDGTGIRDYIHVVDVAKGHLAALAHTPPAGEVDLYNLSTGQGVSVMEMIRAMEKASGRPVPYVVAGRRPGDIACYYGDPAKANRELGWRATKTIEDACVDAWRWQLGNPHGFRRK